MCIVGIICVAVHAISDGILEIIGSNSRIGSLFRGSVHGIVRRAHNVCDDVSRFRDAHTAVLAMTRVRRIRSS